MITKAALLKQRLTINNFEGMDDNSIYKLPKNLIILFADYTYEDYTGDAYVLGYDKTLKQFFEIGASHCSCYELEGQWDLEYFDDYNLVKEVFKRRFSGSNKSSWCSYSANSSDTFKEFLKV